MSRARRGHSVKRTKGRTAEGSAAVAAFAWARRKDRRDSCPQKGFCRQRRYRCPFLSRTLRKSEGRIDGCGFFVGTDDIFFKVRDIFMTQAILNARIYIERGVFAEALLIDENGRIAAVGTNDDILALLPENAETWDAKGRTVVPGFNDSHLHLLTKGTMLEDIELLGAERIADVQARCRRYIEENRPAPGTVLHGMGWNQDYFAEDGCRLLVRQDLDAVSTEYPIILERACGHILTCNSAALALAGITKESVPCEGGAYDRDEAGELTGIVRENACNDVLAVRGTATQADVERRIRRAMAHAAKNGVTSVQTMDLRPADWRTTYAAYEAVQAENPIVRVYHQVNFMEPKGFREFLAEGHRTGEGNEWNRVGPLKMFVDGSLGARTALMREPYHDDPTTKGIATLTPAELDEMVAIAVENKCQVAVHAIGDGAIERVLDAYDKVCDGTNPLRLGIVHVQITDRALLERFVKNDIIAYVQPIFLHYDTAVVEDRVGKTLASTSYAFKTMKTMGIHAGYGTDCPVEDLNPIDNLYCAVNRRNLRGVPEGGFYPEECVDIYDAVDAYTRENAYISSEEHVKGRLMPGYYADLAVLSEDIFTIDPLRLREVKVDATMVGGRFVYER